MRRTQPVPDAVSLMLAVSLMFAPPAAASALGPASEALAGCAAELAAAAAPGAPEEDILVAASAEPTATPAADGEARPPVPADPETLRVRIGHVPTFEATLFSLAATAGPTIWLLNDREAAYDEVAWLAAFGGIMAGPAVGYAYGGQPLRGLAGVGVRTLCLGAAAAGGAFTAAALIGILASDAYDLLMLGPNLNRAAEQRAVRMSTQKLRTSRGTGVGITATF